MNPKLQGLEESYQELADQLQGFLVSRGYADNGTSVRVREWGHPDLVKVEVTIFTEDADGNDAQLSITRTVNLKTGSVRHDEFVIPYDHRNLGLSSVVMQHAVDTYARLRIDRIELTANLELGAYVWARYGFAPPASTIRSYYQAWGLVRESLFDDEEILDHWRRNLRSFKDRLMNTSWTGELDLNDPAAMDMFEEYLLRQASRSAAYRSIWPGRAEETARLRNSDVARMPELAPAEQMRALLTRHQIELSRYSEGLRTRIWEVLDRSERDVRDQLRTRLASMVGRDVTSDAGRERLEALLEGISDIRRQAVGESFEQMRREMEELVAAEADFMAEGLELVAPVILDTVIPDPGLLRSLVETNPFEGRVLSEWAETMAAADIQRIRDQVTIGMISGENIETITRRVLGTQALQGTDGVTSRTRRDASSIAATAVSHFTSAARSEVFAANSDILSEELYVATLDAKTTPVCRALDGNRYPVGEGPMTPQHFRCRSVRVPIFDGRAIGNRPMKAITERQILREYAEREGWGRAPTSRDGLPRGHKRLFDEYARQRIRDTTQIVDANLSYEQFLRQQPDWFVEDVLGRERARLFREGGLTLDRFVDSSGRQYTIPELRQREREAFDRIFGGDTARSPVFGFSEAEEREALRWFGAEGHREAARALASEFPTLSENELVALRHYTEGGYVRINRIARGMESLDSFPDQRVQADRIRYMIDSALKKMPESAKTGVKTYRGVRMTNSLYDILEEQKRRLDAGEQVVDTMLGFTSTTTKLRFAREFIRETSISGEGVIYEIEEGHRGTSIARISFSEDEDEILFGERSRFQVVSIQNLDGGNPVVRLRHLEDDVAFAPRLPVDDPRLQQAYDWWEAGDIEMAKTWKYLNEAEYLAIRRYTGVGYGQLNDALRRMPGTDETDWENAELIAEQINSALAKLKGKPPAVLYRGFGALTAERDEQIREIVEQLQEGRNPVLKLNGIGSFSKDEEVAAGFVTGGNGYMWRVEGARSARSVARLSEYSDEDEYLFPHGSKFEVVDIEEDMDNGVVVLVVREVDMDEEEMAVARTPVSRRDRSPRRSSGRGDGDPDVREIVRDTERTGWEHMFIRDRRTGEVLARGTDERSDSVTIPNRLGRGREIEIHHTHPMDVSLSLEDLMVAQSAVQRHGAASAVILAHTPNGGRYRAEVLRSVAAPAVHGANARAQYIAFRELRNLLPDANVRDLQELSPHLAMLNLQNLGYARYTFRLSSTHARLMRVLGPERLEQLLERMGREFPDR